MGTAIYLNNWCGQRKGDLITLPMAAYRDGCLFFQQSKTGERVELPVDLVPELQQRLDQQLRHNKRKKVTGTTLIQTKSGRPFKQDYFDNLYKKIRERAAETLPDIRNRKFQTLRHTAVVRLAEAGCDAPLIASVTGHSIRNCNDILETYNVRTREAARRAFEKRLNRENQDE
jgi:integrase